MIHFAWLWAGLCLPLPLLMWRFLPAVSSSEQAALKVPFLDDFEGLATATLVTKQQPWRFWLAVIAWCCIVVATMRPQWLGEPIEQGISGRDLILAVDLSGSMEERDFRLNNQAVDRLTATKSVAKEFIARRTGDRLGLILFGSQAYLQAPLTFDRQTVQVLLNEAVLGLAGENTAIGDAIGLAVKRLNSKKAQSRVLILLTDGANTAGKVPPLKAAELAAEYDLKIYTIGIGADEMVIKSFFGSQKVNPSRDLDEKSLTAIAEKTGGQYFRARNTDELKEIYTLLDSLEPIEKDKQFFRPHKELFFWPLAFALALASIISVSRLRLQ